jgi:ATP-dependent DNA ligase
VKECHLMSTTVTAQELHYVDPKANSLKFYRVFTLGGTVAVQYGRLGTFGTFKRTVFDDLAAATAAAVKQVEAKFKKGYEPVKATTLVFDVDPTDTDLDTAMAAVAEGTVAVGVAVSQAEAHQAARACLNNTPIDIDAEVLPRVRAALDTAMTTVDPDAVDGVVRPMLAESIPAGRLEQLLVDDRWCAQQKLDGERFVIDITDGQVAVYNRAGQPKTSNVAEGLLGPFRHLTEGRWVFDGEVVGRKLWLFDLPTAEGFVTTSSTFTYRYDALRIIVDALNVEAIHIGVVTCAYGTAAKRDLLDSIITEQREGIILRDHTAAYQPGKRASVLLKHKLLNEADCVVTAVAVGGKDNATVAVHDIDGTLRDVGAVSTIGKGPVTVGDVIEVQFLYVIDPTNPRMVQPRILRSRSDKTATECVIAQFAHAGTNKAL